MAEEGWQTKTQVCVDGGQSCESGRRISHVLGSADGAGISAISSASVSLRSATSLGSLSADAVEDAAGWSLASAQAVIGVAICCRSAEIKGNDDLVVSDDSAHEHISTHIYIMSPQK